MRVTIKFYITNFISKLASFSGTLKANKNNIYKLFKHVSVCCKGNQQTKTVISAFQVDYLFRSCAETCPNLLLLLTEGKCQLQRL